MKKIIGFVYLIFMLSLASVAQQNEGKLKEARKDMKVAKEDLIQAQKDSVAEYRQFKKESEEKIEANKKTIAELRSEKIRKNQESSREYNKKIQLLEDKNISMKNKVDHYKADGNTNWVVFKRQFNEEMNALQKSFIESRD